MLPPGRSTPEGRIRAMIRGRMVTMPDPQRTQFNNDAPPRAAIETGVPDPMELRSKRPDPTPKKTRPPVRMDAIPRSKKKY